VFEPLPFRFEAAVGRYDYGRYFYHVVYLPGDALAVLGPEPSLQRILGEIAGHPFEAGIVASGGGRYHFIVGKRLLKKAGLAEGDPVSVVFRRGDPDFVDVPVGLREALDADPVARAVWDRLTPGTRRGFAHRISQARRPETREKRIADVLAALEGDDPSPYPRRSR
jgi:hypothetical protein